MFQKIRWAALMLPLSVSHAHGQEWTEQRVLDLFEQQSPMRRETRASAAAAMEAVRGRTLWPNPIAGYSRETVGFTEFITAEQLLPLSGRIARQKSAMLPAQQTAEAQGEARIWETRALLRAAFARALQAQQQAQLLKTALDEVNSIVGLLRIREQEGEGSRYDRVRVERETADLRADIALANAKARSELSVLRSYLPPDSQLSRVSGDLFPRSIVRTREELLAQALESRQELRAEANRAVQLGFEQQAADRLRIPEPSVFGGLKRTDVGSIRGSGAVIGVSIALPIFNKGQTEVARLAAERQRTDARKEILAQQISAAVLGAYDLFVARREALEAFERETGDAGIDLLQMARAGYQDGELRILELLDAYRLSRLTALRRLELQAAVKDSEIELSRNAGFEVTQ